MVLSTLEDQLLQENANVKRGYDDDSMAAKRRGLVLRLMRRAHAEKREQALQDELAASQMGRRGDPQSSVPRHEELTIEQVDDAAHEVGLRLVIDFEDIPETRQG